MTRSATGTALAVPDTPDSPPGAPAGWRAGHRRQQWQPVGVRREQDAGAPAKMMAPSRAAQVILDGVARDKALIVFPASVRGARRASYFFPGLGDRILVRHVRQLRRYRTAAPVAPGTPHRLETLRAPAQVLRAMVRTGRYSRDPAGRAPRSAPCLPVPFPGSPARSSRRQQCRYRQASRTPAPQCGSRRPPRAGSRRRPALARPASSPLTCPCRSMCCSARPDSSRSASSSAPRSTTSACRSPGGAATRSCRSSPRPCTTRESPPWPGCAPRPTTWPLTASSACNCGCRCTPGARHAWSSGPLAPRSVTWPARARTARPMAERSLRTCRRRTSSGSWPPGRCRSRSFSAPACTTSRTAACCSHCARPTRTRR